jgi:DNA repair protein RecO (recombination protein O)
MGGTYKAIGINLKSMPMGESDRLLTILTREHGLIRAIAPGARKPKSSLRGRSNLFVINELLLVRGRSLDKMIQAESVESFAAIGSDLGKLTAGQYLAELVLCQALADHPQPELFALLWEHLTRIDQRAGSLTLLSLVQATYHLLAYGGLTPQVFRCCVTQGAVTPEMSNPDWMAYFDASSGGIISQSAYDCFEDSQSQFSQSQSSSVQAAPTLSSQAPASASHGASSKRRIRVLDGRTSYANSQWQSSPTESGERLSDPDGIHFQGQVWSESSVYHTGRSPRRRSPMPTRPGYIRLTAAEVSLLQRLTQPDILNKDHDAMEPSILLSVERVLRHYAQYHLEQTIRSAELIETCFASTLSAP